MSGRLRSYVGLVAIAAGALFSYSRVFAGTSWIPPVAGSLATAIVVVALLERLRTPSLLRKFLTLIGGIWFVALFVVPDGLSLGLPNPERLLHEARQAFQQALEATTLLQPEPGFLMLAALGPWIAVIVSEQVALAGHPILTALPWIGLFSLASATGAPTGRTGAVLAFFAGLLIEIYLIRYPHETNVSASHEMHRIAAARNAWGAGALGALAAAGAVFLPQIMPDYQSPAWFANQLRGPGSQTVVSPLVQIQPQLRNTEERPLFEVRTGVAPGAFVYWRLVSLDEFNGTAWGTSSEYRQVKGRIDYSSTEKLPGASTTLTQKYTLQELGGPWLPAAYQVTRVSGADTSVDPTSSSIIARKRINPGLSYSVESRVPNPTPQQLRNAPAAAGLDEYKTLTGVSDPVKQLAVTWTQGKNTAYDKVIAITERLRRFRYDEKVQPGHSSDHVLKFLTVTKAGYCEQFSASMAILVRALGIPARVAVGFVQGTHQAGVFKVNTKHAHAWPEVYFAGIGWVPFEPTPRGGLAQPSYAGGPASSESTPAEEVPAEVQEQPAPPPPSQEQPAPVPAPGETPEPRFVPRLLTNTRVAAGLFVLALVAIVIVKRVRRSYRYRSAATPADQVRAAFFDFEDRIIDVLAPRLPNQTPAEFVSETLSRRQLDPGPSKVLLGAFEKSAFSPDDPSDQEAREALMAAAALSAQLWDGSGWRGRIGILLSPRSLLVRSPKGD